MSLSLVVPTGRDFVLCFIFFLNLFLLTFVYYCWVEGSTQAMVFVKARRPPA